MRVPSLILHERLARLGRVGCAAVAVGTLALLVGVTWVLPQWQAVRELRASEADAAVQVQRVKRGELKVALQPEQQALDSLRQQLPGQPQASELIERLYHLASAERISLARGEYALGVDPKPSWRATRSCCQCAAAIRRSAVFSRRCSARYRPWCSRTGAAAQTHR